MVTNAIINLNQSLLEHAQQLYKELDATKDKELAFLNEIAELSDVTQVFSYKRMLRSLFKKALKFSIFDLNQGAVASILDQCKVNTLTLAINQTDL